VLLVGAAGGTRVVLDLAAAGPHVIYHRPGSSEIVLDIKNTTRETATTGAPVRVGAAPTVAPARIVEPFTEAIASVRIPWLARPPRMADLTAESSVPRGVPVAGFRQREPIDGSPATESTLAYLSYDSENLYAAFICRDDPAKVRTHLTSREDIAGDDVVSVYLDTFRDGRHAYVFASNASGVQQDGVINEGDGPNYAIDTLWYSQGELTHHGFAVLITIPFKSVRFSSAPIQQWRIALGRTISRRGRARSGPTSAAARTALWRSWALSRGSS
jgi:hypothetical protein